MYRSSNWLNSVTPIEEVTMSPCTPPAIYTLEDDLIPMEDDKINKQVLSLDMKTKVAWHVPRINIKHLTHRKMTS